MFLLRLWDRKKMKYYRNFSFKIKLIKWLCLGITAKLFVKILFSDEKNFGKIVSNCLKN